MSHHFPGDDRNDLRGYIMHVEKNVAAHTPRIEALERRLTDHIRVAGINAHLFDERVTALEKDRRPAVVEPVVDPLIMACQAKDEALEQLRRVHILASAVGVKLSPACQAEYAINSIIKLLEQGP